jgi:hypothetical protein
MAMDEELDRGRIRDDAVYRGERAEEAISDKAFAISNPTSGEVVIGILCWTAILRRRRGL